jgi:hypothetical protein
VDRVADAKGLNCAPVNHRPLREAFVDDDQLGWPVSAAQQCRYRRDLNGPVKSLAFAR